MLRQVPEIELAAVADMIEERGKPLAGEHGVPYYANYHQMIRDIPDIDIVTIATPSGMHYEHATDILERYGKNIVVEKPTFMTPTQMRNAYELARKKGAQIFPVYQNRYNKAVRRVRQSVLSGELGQVRVASVRLRWCRPQRYYDRDPWRGTWSHDGGALTNQGVHYIDLLRHIAGDVKRVNANKATLGADIEVEDTMTAILEFHSGALGVLEITTAARPDDFEASISIVGSEGLAMIAGEATNKLVTFTPRPQECEQFSENFEMVYGYGHREMYREIANVLQRSGEPPVSFDDGMKSLVLLHAIYRSSEDGTWIDVDEKNQSILLGQPNEAISDLYRVQVPPSGS
jgi:predicted dehydrogenase